MQSIVCISVKYSFTSKLFVVFNKGKYLIWFSDVYIKRPHFYLYTLILTEVIIFILIRQINDLIQSIGPMILKSIQCNKMYIYGVTRQTKREISF